MLEREFEILLRTASEEFLPKGWTLKAQQLSLSTGRLDMLFTDTNSNSHVIEFGSLPKKTVQFARYKTYILTIINNIY